MRRAPANRGLLRRAVWAVARLREGSRLTARDLASEFEVSLRTAYRDFDFLRDEWRLPVEFDQQRGTYHLTESVHQITPITMREGELLALFFAERAVRQYRGTPFEDDLASAFRKIQEMLTRDVTIAAETLDDGLSLDIGPAYTPEAPVFADVLRAMRRRRVARIRYRSLNSGRTTDRTIRPYHVFNLRGDWYVAAHDERRAAVRDFALHRIRRIVITTTPYGIPASFDRDRYLADAFSIEKGARPVDVVVRFAPRQARWIRERRWHRSARIQNSLDGGCTLRLRVSGLGEVRRWVMQFGAEAEVLAPASLRREVAAALDEAGKLYRQRVAKAEG